MRLTKRFWSNGVALVILLALFALVVRANRVESRRANDARRAGIPDRTVGSNSATPGTTSRDGLQRTIDQMQRRLREQPADASAAVTLADALMREVRVSGNAGLARDAEQA